jgi:hypothetical protein
MEHVCNPAHGKSQSGVYGRLRPTWAVLEKKKRKNNGGEHPNLAKGINSTDLRS